MSESPRSNDIFLITLTVEVVEYQQLQSGVQSVKLYVGPEKTIKEILFLIARKQSIFDKSKIIESDVVEAYALYLPGKKANSKSKIIPDKKTIREILPKGDQLTLKFMKRERITLQIFMNEYKEMKTAKAVAEWFYITSTIQDVINKTATKPSVNLSPTNCALFLATVRSKKGIYMEPHKCILDFPLSDNDFIVMKHRQPEEVLLLIQIEDYIELSCARIITSIFNVNITVREALQKIARKGNVFIEEPKKFKLVKPPSTKLALDDHLKDYNLQNGDNLVLRKRGRRASSLLKNWDNAAVVLGDRIQEKNNEEVYTFYGEEQAELFWSLSYNSFEFTSATQQDGEGTSFYIDDHSEEETPPTSEQVVRMPEPEPPLQPIVLKPPETNNNHQNHQNHQNNQNQNEHPQLVKKLTKEKLINQPVSQPQPIPQPVTPQESTESTSANPKRRANRVARPGALPKRNNGFDTPSNELSLICIYYSPNQFWTLAVSTTCTVQDVLNAILELTKKRKDYLFVLSEGTIENGKFVVIRDLPESSLILQIKTEWGKFETQKKLIAIKKSTSTSALSVSFEAEKARSEIPHTLRNSGDFEPSSKTSVSPRKGKDAVFLDTKKEFKWIDPKELKKINKISQGAFAKVYKGMYKENVVAIKTMLGAVTPEIVHQFKSECEVLSSVTQSEYLLKFFGACVNGEKLSIVVEFCPNGSLYDVLNSRDFELNWKQCLKFILQTIRGIHVLHCQEPPLVHRDIKSLNLLLDENFTVKVCDFGLSRYRTMTNLTTLAMVRGTMAYCPPEIMSGHIYSLHSDIYSVGIVMWEIINRLLIGKYERPYSQYDEIVMDFQIIIKSSAGVRPPIPENCPKVIKQLIQDCWQQDYDKRPTTKQLVERLEKLSSDAEKDENLFS